MGDVMVRGSSIAVLALLSGPVVWPGCSESSAEPDAVADTEPYGGSDPEPDAERDARVDARADTESGARPDAESDGPAPCQDDTRLMIWWGVMAFEIEINGVIMHVDPFFRIHRRADYILCSNQFTDHSSPSTKERILDVSPGLKIILEPGNCRASPRLAPLTRPFSRGEVYEDEFFWIKAFYGFEYTEHDLAFLIRDKQTGLWFFHGGDANNPAYEAIREAFAEAAPRRVDYYLCTLGKISIDRIQQIVLDFQPRYLVPAHYPYMITDITDEATVVQFPEEGVPYLRPSYSIEYFVNTMKTFIAEKGIGTRLLLPRPGEEIALTDPPAPLPAPGKRPKP